jgi:hypothetical protein
LRWIFFLNNWKTRALITSEAIMYMKKRAVVEKRTVQLVENELPLLPQYDARGPWWRLLRCAAGAYGHAPLRSRSEEGEERRTTEKRVRKIRAKPLCI